MDTVTRPLVCPLHSDSLLSHIEPLGVMKSRGTLCRSLAVDVDSFAPAEVRGFDVSSTFARAEEPDIDFCPSLSIRV